MAYWFIFIIYYNQSGFYQRTTKIGLVAGTGLHAIVGAG